MAKRIDPKNLPAQAGTFYPPPYDEPCRARERRKLGDAAGLTQFGVNLLRLPPGAWSSQRHWHFKQDEFVYVLEGEVVLVTNAGEEILKPGDCAGFKAGEEDGHHLQNRSGPRRAAAGSRHPHRRRWRALSGHRPGAIPPTAFRPYTPTATARPIPTSDGADRRG